MSPPGHGRAEKSRRDAVRGGYFWRARRRDASGRPGRSAMKRGRPPQRAGPGAAGHHPHMTPAYPEFRPAALPRWAPVRQHLEEAPCPTRSRDPGGAGPPARPCGGDAGLCRGRQPRDRPHRPGRGRGGPALREAGATVFIVPAMGSHGGATAEGQLAVLAGYGITPEAMGCEIRASMDTVDLGEVAPGVPVYVDRHAFEAATSSSRSTASSRTPGSPADRERADEDARDRAGQAAGRGRASTGRGYDEFAAARPRRRPPHDRRRADRLRCGAGRGRPGHLAHIEASPRTGSRPARPSCSPTPARGCRGCRSTGSMC